MRLSMMGRVIIQARRLSLSTGFGSNSCSTSTNCIIDFSYMLKQHSKIGTLCVRVSAKLSAKEVKLYKCRASKIKSIQIIFKHETLFKQETHSIIIWTLTIHKQTSLNFDNRKYIILAQTQYQYHSIIR